LSECLFISTINRKEKVPELVRDRMKYVDIPLLTYAQRIEVLENKATDFVREYFPDKDIKIDRANKEIGVLTYHQQSIRDLIGQRTITNCITET
jgi:ATP-dependent Lon protease